MELNQTWFLLIFALRSFFITTLLTKILKPNYTQKAILTCGNSAFKLFEMRPFHDLAFILPIWGFPFLWYDGQYEISEWNCDRWQPLEVTSKVGWSQCLFIFTYFRAVESKTISILWNVLLGESSVAIVSESMVWYKKKKKFKIWSNSANEGQSRKKE